MSFHDEIDKQMKSLGMGPEFRDLVRRRQDIRSRALSAGLSDEDFAVLADLALFKHQELTRLASRGDESALSELREFDFLEFMDKKLADYISHG